ncbi:hypothetical protein B9Z55_002670 [Caenorhabditis nigoni]|uniref:F-box domain-containing protein n=1 Tax=Caenorhabditis nigoni TaxID=1611254 RepID=A0A2G5VLF4_9PELO|nr:hypothetical protein B9Z55_002670 [Caenorhabditis nigoni]
MPFPILRTSFVVLSEIISLLEPNEIVTASLCSKKLRRLLKNHHQRRKPLKWRLSMFSWGLVDIMTRTVRNRINVIMARHISELPGEAHKSIEFNGYKGTFDQGYPTLYFQDLVFGTTMVVDYVTDLFSLDIHGLIIDRNGMWAFDWINNRQEKLLGGMGLGKNPTYALNEDKTLGTVLMIRNASSSDCVRINEKLGPPDVVLFDNSRWLTYDHLVKMDSIKLFVDRCSLSELDLNSFLRYWRAGGSPRLAYLRVGFENRDTLSGNFDQDLEVVEINEVRRFRVVAEEDAEEIQGDYSIQRWDGVEATISFKYRYFTMVVWHTDENRLSLPSYNSRQN